MKINTTLLLLITILLFVSSCGDEDTNGTPPLEMRLTALRVGTVSVLSEIDSAPLNGPLILSFSAPIDRNTVSGNITLKNIDKNEFVELTFSYLDADKTISASAPDRLINGTKYTVTISDQIRGTGGEVFPGIEKTFTTTNPKLEIIQTSIGSTQVNNNIAPINVALSPIIEIAFSQNISTDQLTDHVKILGPGTNLTPVAIQRLDSVVTFSIPNNTLSGYRKFRFLISEDLGDDLGQPFDGYQLDFFTKLDSTAKFPEISDEELLTKVQQQTFKYFWDFGHPVSGLARERNTSGETVTIGGSGFGVMAIIVGIERGFITRQEGVDRLEKIVTFLGEKADRFHGVWSHWLNGTSGTAIPFSANDDGADLVETAFMIQGLLTARQYLDNSNTQESNIIDRINVLWEEVEWNWFTQNGQNTLFWHWSPNFDWRMNLQIRGWNESLVIYTLAASSEKHAINNEVYNSGWARDGAMTNTSNNSYYGYTMPLRTDRGGPLFFAHYSFLGLDPRNLSDQYANYWTQNVNHTLINRAYCIDNPRRYVGYSAQSWGLTASDGNAGYSAHSPDNDRGVITPTAALSSIPYTPEESMAAMRHFYYILGDRLWGEYGFYDAFNITANWTASSYLAIDQGPIIIMIENHRSGLLWDLFMSAPEVQDGLTKLGFTYE